MSCTMLPNNWLSIVSRSYIILQQPLLYLHFNLLYVFSPTHSMLLNVKDPEWINHFSVEDLFEVDEQLPPNLKEIVVKLNHKVDLIIYLLIHI
jgi:hypothetical protein